MTIPALQLASLETISLNEPHPPAENAIEAFEVAESTIKSEILKSRNHWDLHEPKMWSRAQGVSDKDLVAFTIRDDLVEVRSAATSYGAIILGKIRLPAINDEEGMMDYFDPTYLKNWAGPEHWKLRKVVRRRESPVL